MIEVSHIVNFFNCHKYRLCLAANVDGCYSACFTFERPEMPLKSDGCGTYQAAIMRAANQVFESDKDMAVLWAIESLKGLYKDRN